MSKHPIIDGVMHMLDGREICQQTAAGSREYKRRTKIMADRQHDKCALCEEFMHHDATFEHELGRGLGGANRDDRIEIEGEWRNAAAHSRCNGAKGSRRYHWLDGKYQPC